MPTQVRQTSPAAQQQYSVSGGSGYTASGIAPPTASVSGLDAYAASGPWYIERQSMDIDYFRVPTGVTREYTTQQDWNLSGGSPESIVSGNILRTGLAYRVRASVQVLKSFDHFGTSSYVQPQKFMVSPEQTDMNGADFNAIPVGKLGPRGTITTTEDFYIRRPWIEGTDSTYSRELIGYNFNITNTGYIASGDPNQGGPGVSSIVPLTYSNCHQEEIMGDFSPFFHAKFEYNELLPHSTWHTSQHRFPGTAGMETRVLCEDMQYGALFGGYNVDNEASGIARGFIDSVGTKVANGYGLSNYDYRGMTLYFWKSSRELSLQMMGDVEHLGYNIPRYNISRHDFS